MVPRHEHQREFALPMDNKDDIQSVSPKQRDFSQPKGAGGTSTIDICVANTGTTPAITIPEGSWDGPSGHAPIEINYRELRELRRRDRANAQPIRISKTVITSQRHHKMVEEAYKVEIPALAARLRGAWSAGEAQTALDEVSVAIQKSWEAAQSKRPRHFKPFWDPALDSL